LKTKIITEGSKITSSLLPDFISQGKIQEQNISWILTTLSRGGDSSGGVVTKPQTGKRIFEFRFSTETRAFYSP